VPQLDFGWVTQPVVRENMQPADLLEYNRASIRALSPHFSTIWVEDHLQWGGRPMIEALVTMSFLAAEFPAYRIGAIVLGQSYRNPALLAKMAATLHYLSGGRLIMGIGAGWKVDEYESYGYPFPSAKTRIEELTETIQIFRAMWTQSPATFHGQHYSIENAYCSPLPDPQIPILVGGGGEKLLLRVVAEHADAWNVNLCTPDVFRHKLEVLRQHCQDVGRNPDEIQLTYYADVDLPSDPSDFDQSSGRYMIGPTSKDAIEQLRPFVEMGVSHLIVRTSNLATLERFRDEVAPTLAQ
jgi:alkanesulfonate monooxygenase SsuD/methylene tetrahydromethanopterin reductase-like flavin-dependent oxidoreductase (luciferase family)